MRQQTDNHMLHEPKSHKMKINDLVPHQKTSKNTLNIPKIPLTRCSLNIQYIYMRLYFPYTSKKILQIPLDKVVMISDGGVPSTSFLDV